MTNKAKTVSIPLKGGDVKVARLTPRHMIELGDNIYDQQRKQMLKDLEDCGCDPSEKNASLSKIKRGVASSLLDYVWTMRGAIHVIALACDKDSDSVGDELEATLNEVVALAVDLLGYKMETEDESKDGKKK